MWVMDWRLANSLKTLRAQVNALYPARSKASDGTIGDTAHAAVKSEHNPLPNGAVTAIDITHDPANGADMNRIAEALLASNDPRIWYIIFNKRIAYGKEKVWRQYTGANDHTKHMHSSTSQVAEHYDDGRDWNLKQGEADMAEPINRGDVINVYSAVLGHPPTAAEITFWTGGGREKDWKVFVYDLIRRHDLPKPNEATVKLQRIKDIIG